MDTPAGMPTSLRSNDRCRHFNPHHLKKIQARLILGWCFREAHQISIHVQSLSHIFGVKAGRNEEPRLFRIPSGEGIYAKTGFVHHLISIHAPIKTRKLNIAKEKFSPSGEFQPTRHNRRELNYRIKMAKLQYVF